MIELKSAWINSLRSGISFAASLVFAFIIFRFATVEDIGKYYYWASIVVFGGILFNAPSATMHYILPKKKMEETLSLPATAIAILLPVAVIFYAAVLGLLGFEDALLYGALAAMASVLGQSGGYLFSGFALEKSLIATVLSNLGRLGIILGAAFYGQLDFFWLASSSAITGLLQAVFYLPYMLQVSLPAFKKLFREVASNIGDGVIYYIMNLLNSVMLWADIAFLGLFFSASTVGNYNAVGNLMKYVLSAIPGSISFFILPLVVRGSRGSGLLKKGVLILSFLLGPLMVSAVYPYPFVKLITGGYEEVAYLAYLFLPAMVVLPLQALFTQYLLGKRVKKIVLYLGGATILNVLLNYGLGVQLNYGMEGVALSSSISSLAYTLLLLSTSREGKKEAIKSVVQMVVLAIILYLALNGFPTTFTDEVEALKYVLVASIVALGVNSVLTYGFFRKEFGSTVRVLLRARDKKA